ASPEERKKVPEVEEFFIDLGMPAAEVKKQVTIGDFVVMNEPFLEQPDKVVSKALDNRVACFIAIESVKKAFGPRKAAGKRKASGPQRDVVIVFTVQEEVGLRGATTAANAVGADIVIGLDTTLSCDTPGVPDNQRVTKHGDGIGIMVQDSSMIADHRLIAE